MILRDLAVSGLAASQVRKAQSGRLPSRQALASFRASPTRTDTVPTTKQAPVAQLDRAPDYESGGREFESSPARHSSQTSLFKLWTGSRFCEPFGYERLPPGCISRFAGVRCERLRRASCTPLFLCLAIFEN